LKGLKRSDRTGAGSSTGVLGEGTKRRRIFSTSRVLRHNRGDDDRRHFVAVERVEAARGFLQSSAARGAARSSRQDGQGPKESAQGVGSGRRHQKSLPGRTCFRTRLRARRPPRANLRAGSDGLSFGRNRRGPRRLRAGHADRRGVGGGQRPPRRRTGAGRKSSRFHFEGRWSCRNPFRMTQTLGFAAISGRAGRVMRRIIRELLKISCPICFLILAKISTKFRARHHQQKWSVRGLIISRVIQRYWVYRRF